MIAPKTFLHENDHNQGVLFVEGHDVEITREHMDALLELLDRKSITVDWDNAKAKLEWSNETACHYCRQSPVVARDNQGAPRCADCQDAAVRASRRAAERFKRGLS